MNGQMHEVQRRPAALQRSIARRPRWMPPLSTIQKTRCAQMQGSSSMTWATSRSKVSMVERGGPRGRRDGPGEHPRRPDRHRCRDADTRVRRASGGPAPVASRGGAARGSGAGSSRRRSRRSPPRPGAHPATCGAGGRAQRRPSQRTGDREGRSTSPAPRPDRIRIEPAPDRRAGDLGHNPLAQHLAPELFSAPPREGPARRGRQAAGQRLDLTHDPRGKNPGASPARLLLQPGHAPLVEPLPPLARHLPGEVQSLSDCFVLQALGRERNDLVPARHPDTARLPAAPPLQGLPLLPRQINGVRAFPRHRPLHPECEEAIPPSPWLRQIYT